MIIRFSIISEMKSWFWLSLSHENGHYCIWDTICFIPLFWFSFILSNLCIFSQSSSNATFCKKSLFNHFAFEVHLWTSCNSYLQSYLLSCYVWFSSLCANTELLVPWKQGTILYDFGFPPAAVVLTPYKFLKIGDDSWKTAMPLLTEPSVLDSRTFNISLWRFPLIHWLFHSGT